MKTFEVPTNGMIRLPKSLFKPSDKIVILREADALIIKKLEPARLSSIAARVKERPMSMRDVVKEVRAYRRTKRAR